MVGNKNKNIDETPKNDVIFKVLFANPKHPKLLISLLNSVLKTESPIVKVDIKQAELTPEYLMQRGVRLDILATEENGTIINVEMQKKDEHNMRARATFHCARLFSGQAQVSDKYEDLKKTIVINILDFSLFKNDLYWNKFFLLNPDTMERLTDLVEIHFLEIPKARKKDVKNPLEFWLKFIDNPKAQEIKNSYLWDEVFKEATECYNKVVADPQTQELIRIREKAEMDYNSRMYVATERARKEEQEKAKKVLAKEQEKAKQALAKEQEKAKQALAKEQEKAKQTLAKEQEKAKQALAKEQEKAKQTLAKEQEKAKQALAEEQERARTEKIESAKKMLTKGVDIADIADFTNLTIEEIENLK